MGRVQVRAKQVFGWLRRTLTPSGRAWTAAAWAMLGFWLYLFGAFVISLVLPHFSIEKVAGLIVAFGTFALVSAAALLVFWVGGALKPRFRGALVLALVPTLFFLLDVWGPKGAVIGGLVGALGLSLTFGAGASLLRGRRSLATLVFFLIGAGILAAIAYGLLGPTPDPNPSLAHFRLADRTLDLPDPGEPGPYRVETFTYGGGRDRLRPDYAKVRIVSRPVDGSKLDDRWTGPGGWIRTQYWGFDAKAFPVQGRVWAPQGPGPFPLVLMVHGNHPMEDFSDPGYAYLGALLASQGFIFVSVDENFLNSSMADLVNPLKIRTGQENDARAWLLLEHLVQWRGWNQDRANPMFGKVDMQRLALMGHSRGGEAVATAAAFNQMDRYPDDATQAFGYHFNLGAIVAIAPVDGQYKPREAPTPMRDTNYFVLHGSLDGDVSSFMGSAQYARAVLSPGSDLFKADLYVKDADHNQFNTAWGRNDLGLPFRYLLDERSLLPGEAQRRIAKVYVSAFLHATLDHEDGYRALFQDPRAGAHWLPGGYLSANYADGRTAWLATYDEDADPATGAWPGSTISGVNLSIWKEVFAKLKSSPLDTNLAVLAWDDRVRKARASYGFDLGAAPPLAGADTDLVFSAADAGVSSLPNGFKPPGKAPKPKPDQPLDWTVVVTDAAGHVARLPLSHDQLLYPQIKGQTRRIAALVTQPPSEIVLRRYRFPLRDFAVANPSFDPAHLKSVRFEFDRSSRGAIVLDDVGLGPSLPFMGRVADAKRQTGGEAW